MRLPRDLAGSVLIRRLQAFGYEPTRQSGSHVRLTRRTEEGEHPITILLHSPLRVGTLSAILTDVAQHLGIAREEVIRRVS